MPPLKIALGATHTARSPSRRRSCSPFSSFSSISSKVGSRSFKDQLRRCNFEAQLRRCNLMENGNGGVNQKISCDDVISKLKDDGDFDRLRLKIIRKLKENEELRNSIVSIVKQSAALNRPGAETMKPRKLSDAIHQEVGGKVNEQISDGLWEIIRSPDGMKREITETVKSVYDNLSRPKQDERAESSGHDPKRICKEHEDHKSNLVSTEEADGMSDSEPKEPPGFSQAVSPQIDITLHKTSNEVRPLIPLHTSPPEEQQQEMVHQSRKGSETDTLDPSSPPGFPSGVEHQELGDGSDEDLDAPPGFG